MAYLAVSKGGYEYIFEVKPFRTLGDTWDVAQPFLNVFFLNSFILIFIYLYPLQDVSYL